MPDAVIRDSPDSSSAELAGLIPKKVQLNPVMRFRDEQKLFDKFGSDAASLYLKIDDKKTLAELQHLSGLTEARLLELVEALESAGLIKVYTVFELDAEEGK